jgi:hypothetical protein
LNSEMSRNFILRNTPFLRLCWSEAGGAMTQKTCKYNVHEPELGRLVTIAGCVACSHFFHPAAGISWDRLCTLKRFFPPTTDHTTFGAFFSLTCLHVIFCLAFALPPFVCSESSYYYTSPPFFGRFEKLASLIKKRYYHLCFHVFLATTTYSVFKIPLATCCLLVSLELSPTRHAHTPFKNNDIRRNVEKE